MAEQEGQDAPKNLSNTTVSNNQIIGVPNALFNTVVNYLTSKPYNEVRGLIDSLSSECQLITLNNAPPTAN